MSASVDEARRVLREADCLHPAAAVDAAMARMAQAVDARYADLNPLLLCVMTGGFFTLTELARRLGGPLEIDYIHATRYRGQTSGSGLVWKRAPDAERIRGRHVLVVDDILDEGHTLVAIRDSVQGLQPASLAVAVLTEKLHDRRAEGARAEFVGLPVADRYVFGCGMDYKEYWRQLPAIYAVRES